MAPILETAGLSKSFGMLMAANDLAVRVEPGQLVGIVGPNGSGKTTFINLVTGYLTPSRGRILYLGREITGLHPRDVTRLGIARSFQIPQLYLTLSVLENTLIALAVRDGRHRGCWRPLATGSRGEEARELLGRFGLAALAPQAVSTLPEGGRKLLDVALSFALRPRLLLLDEPTSGVSVDDKFDVMDTLIGVLRESATTAIFVEHDMDVIQRYADRVLLFSEGRVVADDTPAALFADPVVRKSLLGEDEA
jgi:branched-chain amino acid transport system ATP-binding protein